MAFVIRFDSLLTSAPPLPASHHQHKEQSKTSEVTKALERYAEADEARQVPPSSSILHSTSIDPLHVPSRRIAHLPAAHTRNPPPRSALPL
eukprot:1186394-Prorocentrum_minimum.AAC.5